MKHVSRTILFALIAGTLLFSACEKDGPAERAGESVDQAVDNAGEAIEDAGDSIQDAASNN
jgi:hypothetical protein